MHNKLLDSLGINNTELSKIKDNENQYSAVTSKNPREGILKEEEKHIETKDRESLMAQSETRAMKLARELEKYSVEEMWQALLLTKHRLSASDTLKLEQSISQPNYWLKESHHDPPSPQNAEVDQVDSPELKADKQKVYNVIQILPRHMQNP